MTDPTDNARRWMQRLTAPFPRAFVQSKPGKSGGEYVEHSIVTQRALDVIGHFDMSAEPIFGYASGCWKPGTEVWEKKEDRYGKMKTVAVDGEAIEVIVGATVTISFVNPHTGQRNTISEAGACEHPHLKSTNADRLKHGVSDGFKRAWFRAGVAAEMWAQEHYYLDRAFKAQVGELPIEEAPTDVRIETEATNTTTESD